MKTLKSSLTERQLRFDGVSEVEPDQLAHFLLLGIPPSKLRVTEETEEVLLFNAQVSDEELVRLVADESVSLDLSWQLPEPYASLALDEYFASLTPSSVVANARVKAELGEIKKRGMIEFMRTVIYILDQLKANNIVWGVGRGSSCASYLLYLVGLHVVDCVKYDVSMEEFFHE